MCYAFCDFIPASRIQLNSRLKKKKNLIQIIPFQQSQAYKMANF